MEKDESPSTKTPNMMMKKKELLQLRAFPSDIHCGDRHPLEVEFPNSGIDHPNEGKAIEYRLTHTSAVEVPRSGWCLVIVVTATVNGAPWPICSAAGHDCGVSLDKPRYSSSRRLSTHISFAKTPTQATGKSSLSHSARLFLQVSVFKDAAAIYASAPARKALLRARSGGGAKFKVDGGKWVFISFFSSTPSLAVPFVKVDPYLLAAWVEDPVRALVPARRVAFRYDPFTGEVVSPILMETK